MKYRCNSFTGTGSNRLYVPEATIIYRQILFKPNRNLKHYKVRE